MDAEGRASRSVRFGRRSGVVAVSIMVAAATVAVVSNVVRASGAKCPSWDYTDTPSLGAIGVFNGVGVTGCNAWAVGYTSQTTSTLIEHWNGSAWQVQASPTPSGAVQTQLAGAAASSASNAWAVGYYYNGSVDQTLIENWNGTSWQIQPSPNATGLAGGAVNNALWAITATSATNAWAVGNYYSFTARRYQALIEHWDGTSWQIQPSANVGTLPDYLTGVAASSATNAWAVGRAFDGTLDQTVIEHWNGTSWQVQSSPDVASVDNELDAVSAVSSTTAWAVGRISPTSSGKNAQTLIERWNGTAWKIQSSPDPGTDDFLSGVAAVSATRAWAIGTDTPHSLVESWNGSSWKVVPSASPGGGGGTQLLGVAAASPSSVWSVGWYETNSPGPQPFIAHCC